MNLFVQSVPDRGCELIHQTEGGGYFKHKIIKDYHTKISKPVESAKLAHQVKLGNPWNGKQVKLESKCLQKPTREEESRKT